MGGGDPKEEAAGAPGGEALSSGLMVRRPGVGGATWSWGPFPGCAHPPPQPTHHCHHHHTGRLVHGRC